MNTKYIHANWVFDIETLALDMKDFQYNEGLTDDECNAMVGTSTAWNSIKNMNGLYNPDRDGRTSMLLFLKIVNLIDTDARKYFKLDRSLE